MLGVWLFEYVQGFYWDSPYSKKWLDMLTGKHRLTFVALMIAALVLAGGAAWAETPSQLAKRVQKANQKLNSLTAAYTRISRFVAVGPNSGRQVRASGSLLWGRPWNLRLAQDKPREQLVVANDKIVWWVRASHKRADIYPVEQFTSGLKPLMEALGGLASLEETFVVDTPSPKEAAVLEGALTLALVPKVKRADLARLVVWFDAKTLLPRGFRMVTLVGDVTEYRLKEVKANPSVPADSFTYKPPEGFKVRDHRPSKPAR